jgi:hypothetical protein
MWRIFEMELYKKTVQKRMAVLSFMVLAIGLPMIFDAFNVMKPIGGNAAWGDFWHGMLLGMGIAAEILGILFVVRYMDILKDDAKLKAAFIRENDERGTVIASHVGRNTYWFDMPALILGIIIGGYFNQTVSLTCLAIFTYLLLTRTALYAYYHKKY